MHGAAESERIGDHSRTPARAAFSSCGGAHLGRGTSSPGHFLKQGRQFLNWYVRQRREWIGEMLRIYGFINRSHIVAKFDCSPQLAGHDLTAFQTDNPDWVRYDPRRRAYVSTQTGQGSTP